MFVAADNYYTNSCFFGIHVVTCGRVYSYSHRTEQIRTRIDTVMFSVRPRCLPLARVQVNSPSLEHQSPIRRRLISIFTFAGFIVNHPQSCVPGGSGCVRLLTSHSTVILNSISRDRAASSPLSSVCITRSRRGRKKKKKQTFDDRRRLLKRPS